MPHRHTQQKKTVLLFYETFINFPVLVVQKNIYILRPGALKNVINVKNPKLEHVFQDTMRS